MKELEFRLKEKEEEFEDQKKSTKVTQYKQIVVELQAYQEEVARLNTYIKDNVQNAMVYQNISTIKSLNENLLGQNNQLF